MKKLSEQCRSQQGGEGGGQDAALPMPVGDGAVLFEPSVAQVVEAVIANSRQLSCADAEIGGIGLGQWRGEARRELLALAQEQNRRLGLGDLATQPAGPLIVTGHQCVFFHCGVLVKYMLLDYLARRGGGVALNLVVDNDLPKHLDVRVPVRAGSGLKVAAVPLVEPAMEVPMEYQPVPSSERLAGFADRLEQLAVGEELRGSLKRISASLIESQGAAGNLADLMTMLNHRLAKSELGLDWRELPVSVMAGSRVFAGFVSDMLVNAERVRRCYNGALSRWGTGSRGGGPLPELAENESPFWLFRPGQRRGGLFVRAEGESLVLGDGRADVVSVPVAALRGDSAGGGAALLAALKGCNVGIRPRAVTLTVFARLFLADMFVHGLGGARYDQVTDLFIGDYYGIKPPIFVCASATMHLPVGKYVGVEKAVEQLRRARYDRRDLCFNPQRYVKDVSPVGKAGESVLADRLNSLLEQRRAAIVRSVELREKQGNSRQRREVFEEIRRANAELLAANVELAERFDRCVSEAEAQLATVWAGCDREYFFGLFGRERLQMLQSKLG